jgi:hypothetical protein
MSCYADLILYISTERVAGIGRVYSKVVRLLRVCAVKRRRFPVGFNPTRPRLQPEATGAIMEVTIWLKPSGKERHELVTARVCRPQRE